MPKVVQKLPSAISTNPLIAGVGWGDMFHLVIYFRRFWFTSPFSKYSKRDEVVFVQFIDVRLVLGSVSLSRHHKKIKWINTKIVEYGNYNRRNGVVWSAVVLITHCNSLPEAIFCVLKLFLRGYINDGVQAFTAWVGFIIKPSEVWRTKRGDVMLCFSIFLCRDFDLVSRTQNNCLIALRKLFS